MSRSFCNAGCFPRLAPAGRGDRPVRRLNAVLRSDDIRIVSNDADDRYSKDMNVAELWSA